jgi:hypothetical protein
MSTFGHILASIFQGIPSAPPETETPFATGHVPAGFERPVIRKIDVEAVLTDRAAHTGEGLNWRTSMVDLLKILQLDSDLKGRQKLAKELEYSGDFNDANSMDAWLHKQVMRKLAASGGKVPAELMD